jgi:hypothetical protein
MAFPKKISELPKASSIKNSDLFVLVHDNVTSKITFDQLIFSADTYISGGTLTGTDLILKRNNGTDASPIDLSSLSGSSFSWSDPIVRAGNLPPTCITKLYAEVLGGCSPIKVTSPMIFTGITSGDTTILNSGSIIINGSSGTTVVGSGGITISGSSGTTIVRSGGIIVPSIVVQQLVIDDIPIGRQNILNPLILNDIDDDTTSVAIYGLNVVTSASSANIACRLPVAQEGFSSTIINESDMNILVYPSAAGGSINGLIDMAATIPPDNTPYIFECINNPLPGAWTYTAPATNQYVLPEIVIPHTGGTAAIQYWGVGKTGTTIGANTWGGTVKVVDNYNGTFTFSPGPQYWDTVTDNGLPVSARLVRAKVYTNFVSGDTASLAIVPTISRYVAYMNSAGGLPNHTASGIDLTPITTVPPGTLSVPPEIGDFGTYYSIEDYPSNPVISPGPSELDEIGLGLYSQNYFIFSITLFSGAMFAVKDYKFRIILEYI